MSALYDVAVVGAGPAGSVAALHLARGGARVALLDRSHFPRPKPCGEGIMPHGVAELTRLGLDGLLAGAPRARQVRYVGQDGTAVAGRLPVVDGVTGLAGIERTRLDTGLVEAAAALDLVDFRPGSPVTQLERSAAGWRVWQDGDVIGARMLVVAGGLHSRTRQLAGLDAVVARRRRYALTTHVDGPVDYGDAVTVALGRGYEVYLTPVGRERTLVAGLVEQGVMRSLQGSAADRLATLVAGSPAARRLLAGTRWCEPALATGPFGVRLPRASGPGVVAIGDAAGFGDPITGEGISTALLSAREGSRAVLRGLAGDADAFGGYERWRREALAGPEQLTALVLVLSRSRLLKQRALTALARDPGLFDRLLAVNCGQAGLGSIGWRSWLRLVSGV